MFGDCIETKQVGIFWRRMWKRQYMSHRLSLPFNEIAKSWSYSYREYPSVQSEQSFRDTRASVPIRNETPPIVVHYFVVVSHCHCQNCVVFEIFNISRQNNRPWKRLLGFLTPVTATLRWPVHGSIGGRPYSSILEYKVAFRDLPQGLRDAP